MGTVFKKTATKPLPTGATIIVRKGERFAEWIDAKGKRRTAPVTTGKDGADRIVLVARTYTAKYRDGQGIVREVPTGCRDEQAARSVLTELEKRADKVRSGIRTAAEDAVIDHQATPIAEHFAAFIDHQKAKGVVPVRVNNILTQLRRVAADCGFSRLADLNTSRFEKWLLARESEGMSAGTRNQYRGAWVTFCNWCMTSNPPRLLANPFARVPKADEKADPRRKRRALTEDELARLLDAARRRPLLDRATVYRGKRKGEAVAKLRDETRRRLEELGWERALIYKTLVLTGLRKGELASLTVGQLDLDADPPYLVLDAADEKNREGTTIPLRSDLAADLRQWLAHRLERLQEAARTAPTVKVDFRAKRGRRGDSGPATGASVVPTRLPADMPLFGVPSGLVRILNRDLKAAGIPKRDERGRTVDVHAMRTTFGTLLSKSGVAPRTAQAAMRHSKIDLTMNVYTDPRLLDVHGAMEALPKLPLAGGTQKDEIAAKATGTCDLRASEFAPKFAPTHDKSRVLQSIDGTLSSFASSAGDSRRLDVSACLVKRKDPLTTTVNGSSEWVHLDSNQRPLPYQGSALTN